MQKRILAIAGIALLVVGTDRAVAGCCSIHVNVPHIKINPIRLPPLPIHIPSGLPPGLGLVVPEVAVYDAITGKPLAPGVGSPTAITAHALLTVGQAASAATERAENKAVTVAGNIAGTAGKTIMQLAIGPTRYQLEFESTAVMMGAETLSGANAAQLIAAPLAAALRASHDQFVPQAKPVPPAIQRVLSRMYTPAQLQSARYAIGSVSLSVPDLITLSQKTIMGADFAVTVGNIMVFSREPGTDYHWWAHELWHTTQYAAWGIDKFAYNYIANCPQVESDAEHHAQNGTNGRNGFPSATPHWACPDSQGT